MHAGRHYTIKEVFLWTRRESIVFVVLGVLPPLLHQFGIELPPVPWQPIAVLGTAVAFITGFKSNAAYGRLWEARKIWGGIVNTSRTWAVQTRDFLEGDGADELSRRLVRRHIAWMTALRHQLRQQREWEAIRERANQEYRARTFSVPEYETTIEDELALHVDANELPTVLARGNRAVALLDLQSADLRAAADAGRLTEYRHVALSRLIETLFDHQGRAERIKNFPYPRQFATLNRVFVWMFILAVPPALYAEFARTAPEWIWLTAPLAAGVAWIFHTMDKIGSVSENPFEGGPNDIPITAMARGIEIDLLEVLGETELPEPRGPVGNILM